MRARWYEKGAGNPSHSLRVDNISRDDKVSHLDDISKESKRFRIKMKIKKVLGEGSYGSVVSCEKDGEDYAMKTVKGDDLGLVSLQEIDIMNSVYNPFICSARKTYIDKGSTLIFMDLASETLHKHKFKDEDELRMVAFQMICSLAFLEKRDIIHGDIKSNNFLCFKGAYGMDFNVRLTDFSLSCRSYGRNTSPLFKMFCSIYRPLEAWYGEAECKSDVWGLGCCLYELYTGDNQLFPSQDEKYDHQPYDLTDGDKVQRRWRVSNDLYITCLGSFAESTNQNLQPKYKRRIQDAKTRITSFRKQLSLYTRDWKKSYRSLPTYIRDMLVVDPSHRPSAYELFNAEYFAREREMLSEALRKHYLKTNTPCSDGNLNLLDGAVRHHLSRNSLEYEEITYFLSKTNYERNSRIIAIDIFSKCKHIGDDIFILQGCLMIALKLTDPSRLEWFEYERNYYRDDDYDEDAIEEELAEILKAEQSICQTLNYVLYPETPEVFNLTDEQIYAFFL